MLTAILLVAAQTAVVAPQATVKPVAEKMKCRTEYLIYSRIPRNVCMTPAQWDRIAKANRDDLASSRHFTGGGHSGTIANDSSGEVIIGSPVTPHAKGPGPR